MKMNRDNIFLIFLLLTSFYIKACNVDSKGLQTCCCEELIQHDGLLITFDFPLKPSAYNFTTKSDYCHQPGLGVIHPLSVYTPTFFAFDKITEVLSLPILYRQFPKNLNHSIMVNSKYHTFQYSGPDIRYGSYELKNLSVCNFLTIEIDYLRRLGFLKSDIPNDFTFLDDDIDNDDDDVHLRRPEYLRPFPIQTTMIEPGRCLVNKVGSIHRSHTKDEPCLLFCLGPNVHAHFLS